MSGTSTFWIAASANVGMAVLGGLLGAYLVRFFVGLFAPRHDRSFGAFCFMLAALSSHGDLDDSSTRYAIDVAHALGSLVALPIIWWLWFRHERRCQKPMADPDGRA